MKTCTRCDKSKPLDEFGLLRRASDGHNGQCKDCRNESQRPRTKAYADAHKEQYAQYRADTSEVKKAYDKIYNVVNADRNKSRAKKYREVNRGRLAEEKSKWYRDNAVEIRDRSIEKKYGLTSEVYRAMLEAGCTLCGSLDKLHIDHDHTCCPGTFTCGECVRGMLCTQHNVGIGMFNDDTAMLRRAIAYLEGQLP
jgi:hypothetical protein